MKNIFIVLSLYKIHVTKGKIIMRDFSIQEAIDIINSLDNTSEIRTTNHFNINNDLRHNDKELWSDVLFNHELLGINKQAENKFKLCYKHPDKENKDFYLIIVINEFKSLKMITTYEAKSSRRIGENEYR